MFFRQLQWRKGAIRIAQPGFWVFFGISVIVAVTMLYLAPAIVPAADIGHPVIAFAVGMVLLASGVTVRLWSFWTLGQYFTFTVKVSPDQPVVTAGPYRVLRHPGYAGGLLAMIGFGVLYGNWVSFAVIVVLWLVIIIWRIRVEEQALLAALDDRSRSYAAHRKRLIPLLWRSAIEPIPTPPVPSQAPNPCEWSPRLGSASPIACDGPVGPP
jgi:protein-S-isoprenylcysteine O-methyltransferase Ste14